MIGNLNASFAQHLTDTLTVGAQVLLIDDDPASLSELTRMLAPLVDLAATSSADGALESIEAGAQFDALVCPMRLPELSARDLQDRVGRIDPPLAGRMLVLADAAANPADARFLASGRTLVMPRPPRWDRLIATVRMLVARAARRRMEMLDGSQHESPGFRVCSDES